MAYVSTRSGFFRQRTRLYACKDAIQKAPARAAAAFSFPCSGAHAFKHFFTGLKRRCNDYPIPGLQLFNQLPSESGTAYKNGCDQYFLRLYSEKSSLIAEFSRFFDTNLLNKVKCSRCAEKREVFAFTHSKPPYSKMKCICTGADTVIVQQRKKKVVEFFVKADIYFAFSLCPSSEDVLLLLRGFEYKKAPFTGNRADTHSSCKGSKIPLPV